MTKEVLKKFILPAAIAVAAVAAIIVAVVVSSNKEETYRLIKVKSFEGAVTIQREEKMDAFEGLQLISEDSVEVGDASLLELLADSDKHIVAEENTAFVLHSTGTETSGNITIDLLYGKSLFTIDNKLNDESTFEVKTPNATMSVRGTQFEVEYRPKAEETIVEVFEGVVHVIYYGKEELLEKGDMRVIRPDEAETTIETSVTTETESETTTVTEVPTDTETEITTTTVTEATTKTELTTKATEATETKITTTTVPTETTAETEPVTASAETTATTEVTTTYVQTAPVTTAPITTTRVATSSVTNNSETTDLSGNDSNEDDNFWGSANDIYPSPGTSSPNETTTEPLPYDDKNNDVYVPSEGIFDSIETTVASE